MYWLMTSCHYCLLIMCANWLLVQTMVISHFDHCNALLAGPNTCSVNPLQMVHIAIAISGVWLSKKDICHSIIHWSQLATMAYMAILIEFKSLMLSYRVTAGSASIYIKAVKTVFNCGSVMLQGASKRYENRGTPLYLEESFGPYSLQKTLPIFPNYSNTLLAHLYLFYFR